MEKRVEGGGRITRSRREESFQSNSDQDGEEFLTFSCSSVSILSAKHVFSLLADRKLKAEAWTLTERICFYVDIFKRVTRKQHHFDPSRKPYQSMFPLLLCCFLLRFHFTSTVSTFASIFPLYEPVKLFPWQRWPFAVSSCHSNDKWSIEEGWVDLDRFVLRRLEVRVQPDALP